MAEKMTAYTEPRGAAGLGGGSIDATTAAPRGMIKEATEATDGVAKFDNLLKPGSSAGDIIKGIVPDALITRRRRRETISPDRALVRLGAVGTLGVSIEKTNPKQEDSPKVLRGKFVMSAETPGGEPTNHTLEGSTITTTEDATKIAFAEHKGADGTYSAKTTLDVTQDGMDLTTEYRLAKGRKLRIPSDDALPAELTLKADGPENSATTYQLEGAVAEKTSDGLRIVLPAADHLTSQSVTTIDMRPDGITRTTKILPLESLYEKTTDEKTKEEMLVLKDGTEETVVTAIDLRETSTTEAAKQMAPQDIVAPSLTSEGEGAIAKKAAEDAAKAAQKDKTLVAA